MSVPRSLSEIVRASLKLCIERGTPCGCSARFRHCCARIMCRKTENSDLILGSSFFTFPAMDVDHSIKNENFPTMKREVRIVLCTCHCAVLHDFMRALTATKRDSNGGQCCNAQKGGRMPNCKWLKNRSHSIRASCWAYNLNIRRITLE